MLRTIGFLVLATGCVEYESHPLPAGSAEPPDDTADSCVPIGRVDGRSTIAGQDTWQCTPDDPGATEWYGCLWDENECQPTPDRIVVADDGAVALFFGGICASRHWHDVTIDDVRVAPNRMVWTTELHFPGGTLAAGVEVPLGETAGTSAAFLVQDDLALEEAACCHAPDVTFNHEGDRTVVCRQEWRTFAASGDRLNGRVIVDAFDPAPGGVIDLTLRFDACADGRTASLDPEQDEAVEADCCSSYDERHRWDVGEGGVLTPGVTTAAFGPGHCCAPADQEIESCL